MRYRWHEIGLCLVCLVISVMYFLGPSLSTEAMMNAWVWRVFYGGQGVGALVALAGIFWPRYGHVTLKLEQAGMLLVAAAGVIYASAVFKLTGGGWRIVPVESLILFMWVGASLARAWQVRGELRRHLEGRRTDDLIRNGEL